MNNDDIRIEPQTDYADDSGPSFDLSITPTTDKGKMAMENLAEEGLAQKYDDGHYFINDHNIDEGTAFLNMLGIKVSGVYESYNNGTFESFADGAGQGPYGVDYYGYDMLKDNLYRKETVK